MVKINVYNRKYLDMFRIINNMSDWPLSSPQSPVWADLSASAPGGPGATFHHRRIPTKLTSRQPAVRPGGQMEECYFMTVIYHIHNQISTIQASGVKVGSIPFALFLVPFSNQLKQYWSHNRVEINTSFAGCLLHIYNQNLPTRTFKMSIFLKETSWTQSANKVCLTLPLRGKQKKDVDILQTQNYLKVKSLHIITSLRTQ